LRLELKPQRELNFIRRFVFSVHWPGRDKLPIIQTVGGRIAVCGVEAEAKVSCVGGRKMLIQAQHGGVLVIQLPSGAGELVDIRANGESISEWCARHQLRN
jgi:hypothetical protein